MSQVINYETGEVTESMDIVPAADMAALDTLDPASREVAVTAYLTTARDRLALALEATGPEVVAQIKAEIATAAEATKQLGLSREIQEDAKEMVRRAEWALGKAIRKGQEEGTVETATEAAERATLTREVKAGRADRSDLDTSIKPKPTDFATHGELYKTGGAGIYSLGEATEGELEEALTKARSEGNLSRANVVRHVKGQKSEAPAASERIEEITDLAEQGYTSRQIAKRLGIGTEYLSRIRRQHDIEIPADKLIGKTRRHDSTRIVNETVLSLAGLTTALELVDYDDLDPTEAAEWAASLSESFRVLNRFHRKIKETAHV